MEYGEPTGIERTKEHHKLLTFILVERGWDSLVRGKESICGGVTGLVLTRANSINVPVQAHVNTSIAAVNASDYVVHRMDVVECAIEVGE